MEEQLKTHETDKLIVNEYSVFLPAILMQGRRQEFRKAFMEVYPTFMRLLRAAVPGITSSEEILCMLIYLNQSTDDIAAILSINRKSVNQSRYRLRLKIDIRPHESLEIFVHRLMPEES